MIGLLLGAKIAQGAYDIGRTIKSGVGQIGRNVDTYNKLKQKAWEEKNGKPKKTKIGTGVPKESVNKTEVQNKEALKKLYGKPSIPKAMVDPKAYTKVPKLGATQKKKVSSVAKKPTIPAYASTTEMLNKLGF